MTKPTFRVVALLWGLLGVAAAVQAITGQQPTPRAPVASIGANVEVAPPVGKDSVRFLVIGDSGTGDRAQIETAAQMWKAHAIFPYEFAIMLGDNMYGSERPQDYARKFEVPFKALLDNKIEFRASLGNHDDPNQRFYKNFGMGGKRYYSYQKKDARFLALDSNYMDKDQQRWLEDELQKSNAKWKIAYFHHPIYSSGGRHGSELDLRAIVEPIFIKHGLNVVFAGHEHFYERIKPQKGIYHFTAGGSAKLRSGDIMASTGFTAKGFDTEQSFMLVEIDGDVLRFQTISRRGKRVDSGEIRRDGGTS
ncbi:MAG TPA: metallophosphoesterase [Vicinamibacterales bacterium]|nr:metallophosphoesterase [Vicinamibacterales bacterium]